MPRYSPDRNVIRNLGFLVFLCFSLNACFEQGKQESPEKSAARLPPSQNSVDLRKQEEATRPGGSFTTPRSPTQAHPSQAQAPVAIAKSEKPEETCFIATYKHKIARGHTNEETCSHHKNLIQLKRPVTKPGSLCIRVNNTPVPYQSVKGNPDEILISAVAGPQAKITVRYCVGKPLCNEDCKIQKDEFMASIGGDEDDSDGRGQQNLGKWEAGASPGDEDINQKLDPELKRELANIDEENEQTSVYRGWVSDTEVPACLEKMEGRS